MSESNIGVRHIYETINTCNEIICVNDIKKNNRHYLMMEITTQSNKTAINDRYTNNTAKFNIEAWYVYGTINHSLIGKRVCHMGGELRNNNTVKLTNGSVMINFEQLRGLHLGTYMFSKIVKWAKQFDPTCVINSITVAFIDAINEENKLRRNKFYENFGFEFEYHEIDGITNASGITKPMDVSDLVDYENWPNIENDTRCSEGLRQLGAALSKMTNQNKHFWADLRRTKKKRDLYDRFLIRLGYHINWMGYFIVAVLAYQLAKYFHLSSNTL